MELTMTFSDGNDNPILKFLREDGEEKPNWEADFIFLEKFWEPLMKCLLYISNQRDAQRPWNLCVYGSAFSGKTTFFNYFVDALRRLNHLDKFGIVKITCLTNATLKGIYKDILNELNWPYSRQDSIQDLEVLVGIAVRKQGCKLIIIDEFNQLYSEEEKIRINEVLKALRNIPNRTLRPLIVVGTMKSRILIEMDSETNSRFRKEEFPSFDGKSDTDKKDGEIKFELFRAAVYTLDQNLRETTGIVSNFAVNRSVLKMLLSGSKGKMGALVKIYEEAVNIAISKGSEELNQSFLKDAIALFNRNKLVNDEYEIGKIKI